MSTIKPKKILYVDYNVPPSQMVIIRVAANSEVNVYAMDSEMLADLLRSRESGPEATKSVKAYLVSEVGTVHERSVRLPSVAKWYLVIENPWDRNVEVEYTVVAYAPVIAPTGTAFGFGQTSTSSGIMGFDNFVSTSSSRQK